ncbi:hypothetical protein [Amycolatopsis sp. PS_44_ISF1]|uniref:hypothetical protein n=1 Tax=Amycolatopsis sp. PS_44_ISF1 TaxID=2974917 RepID=UPI0028DE1C0A|nr:hypothetical protein [Amycolatopsis sp. PS_44_ISF1]MDT8913592.1 hypothetical protein [Amycolatopsis sp. PS_44_ISF1]
MDDPRDTDSSHETATAQLIAGTIAIVVVVLFAIGAVFVVGFVVCIFIMSVFRISGTVSLGTFFFSVVGAGTAVVGGIPLIFFLRTRVSTGKTSRRGVAAPCLVTGAGQLLPAEVREQYCEEWAGWLADLREGGVSRARWWVEVLSIVLGAAPRLAVTLRWTARREADR